MPAARAAPSSTSARASIRREAAPSRHRLASRRSSPAPSSCRVIPTVMAPPLIGYTADQPRQAPRGSERDDASAIRAVAITSPLMSLSEEVPVTELRCKHCGSGSFVRNGMANGRQRYRCKACGRSFTATPARGKPPAMKALAVLLYGLGNVSQGMIAKLLGVSHVAVYKWVRAAGEGTPAPSATPSDDIV